MAPVETFFTWKVVTIVPSFSTLMAGLMYWMSAVPRTGATHLVGVAGAAGVWVG